SSGDCSTAVTTSARGTAGHRLEWVHCREPVRGDGKGVLRARQMGILRDFERRLEGAVEGLFARAFRSGVQPVELGKRLVREVEDGRTVGVNRVYVPNVYVYELSPGDRERFADYEVALARELAALAVDTARERGWGMRGPPGAESEPGEALAVGRFRLSSRVEADEQERDYAAAGPAGAAAAQPVGPHTAMLPGQRPRPKVNAPARLGGG